jgi:hypothetical protein
MGCGGDAEDLRRSRRSHGPLRRSRFNTASTVESASLLDARL